jgi:hypothetical protein
MEISCIRKLIGLCGVSRGAFLQPIAPVFAMMVRWLFPRDWILHLIAEPAMTARVIDAPKCDGSRRRHENLEGAKNRWDGMLRPGGRHGAQRPASYTSSGR